MFGISYLLQKWSLVFSHTLKVIENSLKSDDSYSRLILPLFLKQIFNSYIIRGIFNFWQQWWNSLKSPGQCQTLINFFLLLNKTVSFDGHRRVFTDGRMTNIIRKFSQSFLKYVSVRLQKAIRQNVTKAGAETLSK